MGENFNKLFNTVQQDMDNPEKMVEDLKDIAIEQMVQDGDMSKKEAKKSIERTMGMMKEMIDENMKKFEEFDNGRASPKMYDAGANKKRNKSDGDDSDK